MTLTNLDSRRKTLVIGLLMGVICGGCGGAKPWDKVYPAQGVVTHKGKPVKDAELAFFPIDPEVPEQVRPWAKTNENGEFRLSTYDRDDGAPAGSYKVTIVHHEIVISGGSMGTKPNDLPAKYASKETTDLTVEIEPQDTVIPPIDLK